MAYVVELFHFISQMLKIPITEVMGRLDNLVEAIYSRYKDRYFQGERMYFDLSPFNACSISYSKEY